MAINPCLKFLGTKNSRRNFWVIKSTWRLSTLFVRFLTVPDLDPLENKGGQKPNGQENPVCDQKTVAKIFPANMVD